MTANGELFVIINGTRKLLQLFVECLDFLTRCASPKGECFIAFGSNTIV